MTPYIGEIRPFPYTFAPNGWLFCEGQLLPIDQNEALFALIGTTYGGDGETTFALPDLRGRVPVSQNGSVNVGEIGGAEQVAVTIGQIPAHNHPLETAGTATGFSPAGAFPGVATVKAYGTANATLAEDAVGLAGTGESHDNRQPYLAIGYAISLFGVFPSRN